MSLESAFPYQSDVSAPPSRLPEKQHLLDAVLEQMLTGFVVVGAPSGEVLYWNQRAVELLGHPIHPVSSVDGYSAYGAEHEDGRVYAPAEYPTARALAGEYVQQHLMRYRRGDGTLIWLMVSAAPVYDANQRMTHAVSTCLDVSSQQQIDAELRAGRERLRAALDASHTGTFRWDMRTNALEWDENLDRLFGLTPGQTAHQLDEFIGLVHPDDQQQVIDAVTRCVEQGVMFDEEFRIVRPDGTVRWLYDRGQTFTDAEGRPLYMTGACVDVTERRVQQEQLRIMAETMPQLVWTATADGRVDYYNERWYEYTGMPRAANDGKGAADATLDWSVYLHPDHRASAGARWKRSVATGEPYEQQYGLLEAKTGKYRWFIARALPMRDPVGQIVRWFGTCTEIEAQVQSASLAEWLQVAASRLAQATTAAEVGSVVAEVGCEAVSALAASVACFGTDGRTLTVVAEHGDSSGDAPTLTLPLLRGSQTIGSFTLQFRAREHVTVEQERFLTQLSQHGADALERVRLFEAERAARAAAEAANRAKSEFLASMGHELRTPLNAIQGYVQLLELELRGPITPEQRADLARVQQSQRHLLGLINDILNFAKIEAGQVSYDLAPVDAAAVVADAVPMIVPQAQAKEIAVDVALPEHPLMVVADREKLGQVILNLLSNAVKFTPRGGRVVIDAPQRDGGGDSGADAIHLRVSDTGPGIDRSQQERIFDPFVQVSAQPRHRHEGTGLGLAISRDLARGMGGDLRVRSTPGEGAAFTVTLRRSVDVMRVDRQ